MVLIRDARAPYFGHLKFDLYAEWSDILVSVSRITLLETTSVTKEGARYSSAALFFGGGGEDIDKL